MFAASWCAAWLHCVAAAVEAGGGVVMTGDQRDLDRLAAPYPHVHVAPV